MGSKKWEMENMINRICPSEEVLSEYLSGGLSEEKRLEVEKHLIDCKWCRTTLVEAYNIISKPSFNETLCKIIEGFKKNCFPLGAFLALLLSFFFRKYFLQFLAISLIMAAKWIIDAKTTKTLITVYEAWKGKDKAKTDEVLSRPKSKRGGNT